MSVNSPLYSARIPEISTFLHEKRALAERVVSIGVLPYGPNEYHVSCIMPGDGFFASAAYLTILRTFHAQTNY